MKTPEEILDQFEPNSEYPSYYHESNIIQAMEQYASQFYSEEQVREAIELAREEKDFHGYKYTVSKIFSDIKNTK